MKNIILIAASFFILVGCSSLSKEDCEQMNWQSAGKETALKGESLNSKKLYFEKECAIDNSVKVDSQKLSTGYNEGLNLFCKPDAIYDYGKNGSEYIGICEKFNNSLLTEKYKDGRIHFLEKKVSQLEGQNSTLESEVSSLQNQLTNCSH
jgi:hypothetical protein